MRALVMVYGIVSYLLFFASFVYLIAFVGGIFVPKSLASPATLPMETALMINLGLMLLWGVQHSIMARPWFKKAIETIVPAHTERSTYVLASAIVLSMLMYFWQPVDGILWNLESAVAVNLIWAVFGFGWLMVLLSSFLTDHFDLFGLRQTWLYFVKRSYTNVDFTERLIYRWVRHPMMLGLLIGFWAIPTMNAGHFVFAAGMSIYILIGIHFEEKSLIQSIGSPYADYRQRTSRILPKVF